MALRQAELDAGEQERKKREVDLAVAFMKVEGRRQEALKEVEDAETTLGGMVDELIQSGSTYQRCEVLVEMPQDELRRLRTLARQDGRPPGAGATGERRTDTAQPTRATRKTAGGRAGRREAPNAGNAVTATSGEGAVVREPGPPLPPSADVGPAL